MSIEHDCSLFLTRKSLAELAQIKHVAITGSPINKSELKCSTSWVPPDPTYYLTTGGESRPARLARSTMAVPPAGRSSQRCHGSRLDLLPVNGPSWPDSVDCLLVHAH